MHRSGASTWVSLIQTPERPQEPQDPMLWRHRAPRPLSYQQEDTHRATLSLSPFIEAAGPRLPQAGTQARVFLSSAAFRAHRAHKTQGRADRPSQMRGAPTPSTHGVQKPLPGRGCRRELCQQAGKAQPHSFLLPCCWLWNFWCTTRRVVKKLPRKRRRKGKPHMSTWGRNRGQDRSQAWPSRRPLQGPSSPATPCTLGPGPG